MHRLGGLWCLGLLACQSPLGFTRPTAGDGVLIVDGGPVLKAVFYPAAGAPTQVRTVGPAETLLWLDYGPGALASFLTPEQQLLGSAEGLPEEQDGSPTPAGRLLPIPLGALLGTPEGWTPIAPPESDPRWARFRLPAIDPFDCAALGGCFDTEPQPSSPSLPVCGPCPSPPRPAPPAPPVAPAFRPCPSTMTATAVAGLLACRPALACDPATDPACFSLTDCPGRSVLDLGGTLSVGGPGCGGADWPCTLEDALGLLDQRGTHTATLALAAGRHNLSLPGSGWHLVLRGLCPARSAVEVVESMGAASLRFEDLSLAAATPVTAPQLSLQDCASSTALRVEAAQISIQGGTYVGGELDLDAPRIQLQGVRLHQHRLLTSGEVTIDASVLSEMGWVDQRNGQWSLHESSLEILGSPIRCSAGGVEVSDALIRTTDDRMFGPQGDGDPSCALQLRRVVWQHSSPEGSNQNDLLRSAELGLSDVAVLLSGAHAKTVLAPAGVTSMTRVILEGPIQRGVYLDEAPIARIADLSIHASRAPSIDDSPLSAAVRGEVGNDLEIHRLRFTGLIGIGLMMERKMSSGGRIGKVTLRDLDLSGAAFGGMSLENINATGQRIWIHDCGGSGVNLFTDGLIELSDLSIEGIDRINGCGTRFLGHACLGSALVSQDRSNVRVDRFRLEQLSDAGLAILGSTATASRGFVSAEIPFVLDGYLGDPRDLLRGVQLAPGTDPVVVYPNR